MQLDGKSKISIITPVFNDEGFIEQTIECVLNQTYSNFELIIIDDCSPDNSMDIVQTFKDERIRIIHNQKNEGAAYSRNVGIAAATGDYIAFLDGDDLWEPDKLEKQLSFMLEHNYLFSASDYIEIDENGKPNGRYLTAPNCITRRKMVRVCYIGCLTVMYKRDIFPNLAIPEDIKKRNDYALWLKLSERANCYVLHEPLASYRKRQKSISSGSKTKLLKFHKALFIKLYRFNKVKASFYALRNAFYYFWKRAFYCKKHK